MIRDILKGIIIGIANVIPGVSGGTLAVSMGIYDKIIGSITNMFKNFKSSVKILFPYAIGMALGIIVFSFVITFLFEKFPIPTNFMFVGLILGGLPIIINRIKGNKLNIVHALLFLAFAALVVFMGIAKTSTGADVVIKLNAVEVIKLFAIGIVAAATMVIPGVSGSMMLTLLGYYHPITSNITSFIKALTAFDMNGILNSIGILLPFGIGAVVGIIVIAKIIEFFLKKCPSYVFASILGLIVASPFAILCQADFTAVTIPTLMISVVTLAIGTIVALKLGKE